jgi:thioester reductase-like protein
MKTVSLQDEMQLIDNVSVIFHSAATVKFDEDLTK